MATTKFNIESPLEVNWEDLTREDPEFKAVRDAAGGAIQFKDTKTFRQITVSTLKVYFGLEIQLPLDRLCPPVPGRYEYIRWITTLLKNTSPNFDDKIPGKDVTGLDIGTGASCIYPLLGCATHQNWHFVATELDDKSYQNACKNVEANKLEDRVKLQKVEPGQMLLDPLSLSNEGRVFDFTMCNPPFYSSKAEIREAESAKSHMAAGVCTGAEVEMITKGGELSFVSKMVKESTLLRDRVKWFSTMLGFNYNGTDTIIPLLKKHGVQNYTVTFFQPGQFTKRAGIAWSFGDMRPLIDHEEYKGSPQVFQRLLPLKTKVLIEREKLDRTAAWKKIGELLLSRGVVWRADDAKMTGVCLSKTDVWSRSARRRAKKARLEEPNVDETVADSDKEFIFAARISLQAHTRRDQIEVRWLKGTEERFFTSLQSNLRVIADECEHSVASPEGRTLKK